MGARSKPETPTTKAPKDFPALTDHFDPLTSHPKAPSPGFRTLHESSKPMALITHSTRLPARCMALAGISIFSLIGLAGARHTIAHWNGEKAGQLSHAQMVEDEKRRQEAALEAQQRELAGQAQLAESYSDLGTKQATCGDTLSQFYYQPGGDVMEQLNVWGIDWATPRYNTHEWFPLFDSANVLFAAIRQNPATGYQVVVTTDQQPLNQASICLRNELNDTVE